MEVAGTRQVLALVVVIASAIAITVTALVSAKDLGAEGLLLACLVLALPAFAALAGLRSRQLPLVLAGGVVFYVAALPFTIFVMPGHAALAAVWACLFLRWRSPCRAR